MSFPACRLPFEGGPRLDRFVVAGATILKGAYNRQVFLDVCLPRVKGPGAFTV